MKEAYKIYFDLDGVLADFGRGIRELCGLEPTDQAHATEESDNRMWASVRACGNFYDRLEPMPGTTELFRNLFEKYGPGQVQILSTVPKPKRGIITAEDDKRSWVKRILGSDVKVNITHAAEDKVRYISGSGQCILVDDPASNIALREEKGGTGILFVSAEDAEQKFRELGIL